MRTVTSTVSRPGISGISNLAHRMSGVTAACMAVRREAWRQVGGFDEASLPNVLNDVDLCLRLSQSGWDIVWTPYAELFHHESTSRGIDSEGPQAEAFARAVSVMETKWGIESLRNDPRYSPNLSLDAEDFSLGAGHPGYRYTAGNSPQLRPAKVRRSLHSDNSAANVLTNRSGSPK